MNEFIENYNVKPNQADIAKKNNLDYLKWATAVKLLKSKYPGADITVKKWEELPYLKTELGYFVEVQVKANDFIHSEMLPVLDYRNKPIMKPTVFDINSSIKRCTVKAIAFLGFGLFIYEGKSLDNEDNWLFEEDNHTPEKRFKAKVVKPVSEKEKEEAREKASKMTVYEMDKALNESRMIEPSTEQKTEFVQGLSEFNSVTAIEEYYEDFKAQFPAVEKNKKLEQIVADRITEITRGN